MTFEEKAIDMMFKRGMSKVQAHEVLKMVKEDVANDAMKGRWHDNMEGWPRIQRILENRRKQTRFTRRRR